MKSLAIISQYFYPSESSTAQLLTDLTLNLARTGYSVEVFTGSTSSSSDLSISPEIKVLRPRSSQQQKYSIVSKVLSSFAFLCRGFLYVLSLSPSTPLLIVSNPPYAGILGLSFRYFKRGNYTFLFQDIFPESANVSGVLTSQNILFRVLDRLMNLICQNSQHTIVLTTAMQAYLSQKYPNLSYHSDVHLIENWAVEPIIPQPNASNPFARKHKLDKIFTVLYSGNIGRLHDIETIAESIYLLRHEPIQFVFIGDGPKQYILMNYLRKYQLTNLLLLPFQPRPQLSLTLTACDLSLMGVIPGAEHIIAPCKLYGMLAAGRGIVSLSSSGSYLEQLLSQYNCGVNLPPQDPMNLASCIQSLSTNLERVATLGYNAHQLYKERYQVDRAIREYENVLFDHLPHP